MLGIILITGYLGGEMAKKFNLPSLTGYIITGLILGPSLLDVISSPLLQTLQPINDFALGLIGLSIGGELKYRFLQKNWEKFNLIFLGESLLSFFLVFLLIYFVSGSLPLALMLGILSLATTPTSILGVIKERDTRGEFPRILMSIGALDNFFCVLGFSIITTKLNIFYYEEVSTADFLGYLGREVLLGIILGLFLGSCTILVIERIEEKRKIQVLLITIILFAIGMPRQFDISFLIVTLLIGALVVNLTVDYRKFYQTLQAIDTPILIIFLTMAGARFQLDILPAVSILAAIYITARLTGKIIGARLGMLSCLLLPSGCQKISPLHSKYVGMALTPQAGVAIGLAILAEQKLPLQEGVISTLILGSIIFFELVGPLLVNRALVKTGSIKSRNSIPSTNANSDKDVTTDKDAKTS